MSHNRGTLVGGSCKKGSQISWVDFGCPMRGLNTRVLLGWFEAEYTWRFMVLSNPIITVLIAQL